MRGSLKIYLLRPDPQYLALRLVDSISPRARIKKHGPQPRGCLFEVFFFNSSYSRLARRV